MKKEWTKKNSNKKDKTGKHIQHDTLAESAANYFSKDHWGKKDEDRTNEISDRIIIEQKLPYNNEPITVEELDKIIRRFKRRKKPGPDALPMEIYKELNKELKTKLLYELNVWWKSREVNEEQLKATVVLI